MVPTWKSLFMARLGLAFGFRDFGLRVSGLGWGVC